MKSEALRYLLQFRSYNSACIVTHREPEDDLIQVETRDCKKSVEYSLVLFEQIMIMSTVPLQKKTGCHLMFV
jgi:hypothetical protein